MDAFQKRHMGVTMKLNSPNKNKERLLKQRYTSKSSAKKKTIADNSASTSSTTDFINRSTKVRSIKKAEKALPKSQSKQKAVVRSLAQKFKIRILPQNESAEKPKRGRKKNDLNDEELVWLEEFTNRPHVIYTTSGKKDQVYIGKVDGEKVFKQKTFCGH